MFWLALKCAAGALIFLVIRLIYPEFATFGFIALPLIVSGINVVFLLIYLWRVETKKSVPLLLVCEVSLYTLITAVYGGALTGRLILARAPPDATLDYVVFIAVMVFIVGVLSGMCMALFSGFYNPPPRA